MEWLILHFHSPLIDIFVWCLTYYYFHILKVHMMFDLHHEHKHFLFFKKWFLDFDLWNVEAFLSWHHKYDCLRHTISLPLLNPKCLRKLFRCVSWDVLILILALTLHFHLHCFSSYFSIQLPHLCCWIFLFSTTLQLQIGCSLLQIKFTFRSNFFGFLFRLYYIVYLNCHPFFMRMMSTSFPLFPIMLVPHDEQFDYFSKGQSLKFLTMINDYSRLLILVNQWLLRISKFKILEYFLLTSSPSLVGITSLEFLLSGMNYYSLNKELYITHSYFCKWCKGS
jgi:hypothetical protein